MIQKRIISRANAAGVFVITATQMLESMADSPRPARAVLLPGETSVGRYPVGTVQMISRIISEAEAAVHAQRLTERRSRGTGSFPDAIGYATTIAAQDVSARAIVAFIQSGATAFLISKRRPQTPIVAFTLEPKIARQLSLCRGTEPHLIERAEGTDEMIREIESRLLAVGRVHVGENLLILSGAPITAWAETNLLKLHRVG
ncbi:TPA: hypothetical protein DCE37_14870 [Candidatus Latescibacteria bacterium]|nr:hypothetical protein [Candidatus Latescibacterota bacterium]